MSNKVEISEERLEELLRKEILLDMIIDSQKEEKGLELHYTVSKDGLETRMFGEGGWFNE